jgi:hypothetical protein
MAKIVEAVRPSAAQRIATERSAIAEVEREIAELEQQRAARLVSDDDPAEALKLAGRIAEAYRRLETRLDRIKALERHGKRERTDRRQTAKAAALSEFEKRFAARRDAAARITRAISELSEALKEHQLACRAPFSAWPHELFPDQKIFQGLSYSFAAARIAAALRMQNPGAAQTLLTDLPARLGDLAAHDAALAASLIEDIRSSPLPQMPETEAAAA